MPKSLMSQVAITQQAQKNIKKQDLFYLPKGYTYTNSNLTLKQSLEFQPKKSPILPQSDIIPWTKLSLRPSQSPSLFVIIFWMSMSYIRLIRILETPLRRRLYRLTWGFFDISILSFSITLSMRFGIYYSFFLN